jgi:cell division protein FtsI (penicillin-binding protein 3)/stage V sporulation protein D (sporulation-specific penicillin-binding protein)
VGVDPQSIREADRDKLPELAKLLNKPLAEIERALHTKTKRRGDTGEPYLVRWVPLAKDLDQDTADAIAALGIKGVYGNSHYSRTYPGGQLAAHVLGFVNKEETPCQWYRA